MRTLGQFERHPPLETSLSLSRASPPTPPGAFVRQALIARENGLAVIPCGGDDGKKPLTKWGEVTRPSSERQIKAWLSRPIVQSANLGIITGTSGLTVIDCDTPGRRADLEALFGDTPVVVSTPRGGLHLYYMSNGERCGRLKINGMQIDVKGVGGFVVAPPSVRKMPDDSFRSYNFEEGDWTWCENLPAVRTGALPEKFYRHEPSVPTPSTAKIPEGQRNTTLFDALRGLARDCATQAELLQHAILICRDFSEPLPAREIETTVNSVWRYKMNGQLIAPSAPALMIPTSVPGQLCRAKNGADAFMLLAVLLTNHGARARRGEDFAIGVEAMVEAGIITRWGTKRYRGAIQILMTHGLIVRLHKGGAKRGDPSRYKLAPPALN